MLSPAVEDYLKAIYKLHVDRPVSTNDLARSLHVSPASVTRMAQRLARSKMVEYELYRGVRLTEAGEKLALEIIRHHRLLETYLREMLGYSWADVHAEAEHLEHHISEAFEAKIDALLGYPTHDPHGHPIPTADLQIAEFAATPLPLARMETKVVVRYVSDTDAAMLEYLEQIDLMPQNTVRIVAKAPQEGPLTLHINGKDQIVRHDVANCVHVSEAHA